AQWRLRALDLLRRRITWDDTFWGVSPTSSERGDQVYSLADPREELWLRFLHVPDRYRISIAMERTWQAGGAGIDVDLMSARQLARSPLYAEILRPVGVRTTMTLIPFFRGIATSCIGLSRHGRTARFRASERELALSIVGTIGVVERAFSAG